MTIDYTKMYEERITTCRSCPVFVDITQSCGVYGIAKLIAPLRKKEVHNGRVFVPCGCHMPTKAHFTMFDCPAGKWPEVISKSIIQDLKALVRRIKMTNSANIDDRKQLQDLYISATGEQVDLVGTACGECINRVLRNIEVYTRDMTEGTPLDELDELEKQLLFSEMPFLANSAPEEVKTVKDTSKVKKQRKSTKK